MKTLLLTLISFTTFAQNPPLKLEIESITFIDSISTERTFTINYHIENLTDNEVSFFLNPNNLIANSRASMSKNVSYNLYENDEKLYLVDAFTSRRMLDLDKIIKSKKNDEEKNKVIKEFLMNDLNLNIDSIPKGDKDEKKIENHFLKKKNEMLLNSRIKLAPKELKKYSIKVIWDKTRYFKIADIQFYIDEKLPHYIDLTINLMKEEFKDKLTTEEYQKTMGNSTFISGWFTSNKMEINFKE